MVEVESGVPRRALHSPANQRKWSDKSGGILCTAPNRLVFNRFLTGGSREASAVFVELVDVVGRGKTADPEVWANGSTQKDDSGC